MVLMGEEAVDFALPLIAELRQKGIYVDYNPEKGSFKAQLKAADSMNARYALIIGEQEAISRTLVLKDLSSGEQQSLSADELLSFPFEA
jgi:histidyl-tRNA synthetase